MSLSPWDKVHYWLTGSFPKKTARRLHEEFEKLQEETAAAFKARKESKAELKSKAEAKAPAKPKATTTVKKTSAPKATPATKAKPKPAGKSSNVSTSKKKPSK